MHTKENSMQVLKETEGYDTIIENKCTNTQNDIFYK